MNPTMTLTSGVQHLAAGDAAARIACGCPAGAVSRLVGFIVVLLAWQIALLAALLCGFVDLGHYAGFHFISCAVLVAWLVWRWSAAPIASPCPVALQMVAWTAAAGPFGAFVAAALAFWPAPIRADVMTSHVVESPTADGSVIERAELMHLAMRDRRIRIEGAHHIRPLMDVIAEGSQSEKLEAMGVVYRRYDAALGPVLKRALQDPDTSIRVLAATVTAKLNATFSRKIGDCQAASDAAPNLAQSWRDIAEARLAYAESGLLEGARARTEIETAIVDLARAAEIDPTDRDTVSRLNRARQRLAVWRT